MVRLIRRRQNVDQEERGAVLVLTAFAMILLLGMAALVIDIVILQQARIRAQATVDSAALAAAQDLPNVSLASAVAQEYALRNYNVAGGDWSGCTDPQPLSTPTGVNCISVNDATSPTLVRVRLPNREVSTFFAPLLGVDAFSVSATATAQVEYSGGSTGIPTDGDADPADFQQVADFLRAGDPGGGYDKCVPKPKWLDVSPGSTFPPGEKWGEYIFVFEHLDGTTQTVCGTSSDAITDPSGTTWQWGMDTWVAGTGGTTHPGPGMPMHVSCSQNFIAQDGWDADLKGNGPQQGIDTDWHLIVYIGARYQVSEGPDPEPDPDKPVKPPAGEVFIKNACGYSFTAVTSEPPTPHIRLSD